MKEVSPPLSLSTNGAVRRLHRRGERGEVGKEGDLTICSPMGSLGQLV